MATFKPAASADDAQLWWDGSQWVINVAQVDMEIGWYSAGYAKMSYGVRFPSVNIPKDSTILTAKITIKCSTANTTTTVNTHIRGELSTDVVQYSTAANWAGRTRTTAIVDWNAIPSWVLDTNYDSPSIVDIVQEIVNQAGWSSGNALGLFWDDADDLSSHTTNALRYGHSYNGSTTECAILTVTWTPPPATDIKSVAGVLYASIKKISGVAIASVKKVAGVA